MFRIGVCRSESEFEKGLDFLLRNRRDFLPGLNLGQILYLYKGCLHYGEVIAAWNKSGEMVGILGYVNVPPERNKDHQVSLRIACIAEPYRRTGLFYQGLKFLAGYFSDRESKVEKIDLFAPEKNKYLNNLFSKFAMRESTVQYNYMGTLNHFSVTLEQLNKFRDRP
jgi:hypothetical protein